MTDKRVDPKYLPLVTAARERRQQLLEELRAVKIKPYRDLRAELASVEHLLGLHDPTYTPEPRRLSHLKPVDAAIQVLIEAREETGSGKAEMPRAELIRRLVTDGVGFGHAHPERDLLATFGQKTVQKILIYDAATGLISLPTNYLALREKIRRRMAKNRKDK
jgi:hypothetical protein